MRSLLVYFVVWLSGVVLFTISYTIYLRENDMPVRYEHEIPDEIRFPVYIFAGIFLVLLFLFKFFIGALNQNQSTNKKKK